MVLFFESSLIQAKESEGLQNVGGAFNEKKTSELHNSEILKWKKENKKPKLSNSEIKYLIKFPSYVTRFFNFHFFILKFPSYEKVAMMSQSDLTRCYDVIIRNSVFKSGIPDSDFLEYSVLINMWKMKFWKTLWKAPNDINFWVIHHMLHHSL